MEEISLHILDLVENSISAGATRIEITVVEDLKKDILKIRVKDNGKGMSEEEMKRVFDPFFTTKGKRTGLGLPLIKQSAEATGGNVKVKSKKGKGTIVEATFVYSHIDRQPLGDIGTTIATLFLSHPEISFIYKHIKNGREIKISSRRISPSFKEIKEKIDSFRI
jgi:DNA mismatch repair ATPase MutL